MKTAVEWLINQFLEVNVDSITNENMYIKIPTKALKKAKEMEKEQIIDACKQCSYSYEEAEQYYNETFKSEE
jgi:hypothetical protein